MTSTMGQPQEIVVPGIVSRNGHDRAGSVAHHDIVRDKDRDFLSGCGIHGADAFEAYAGLVLSQLNAFEFGLFLRVFLILPDSSHIRDPVLVFVEQRMFGGDNHKGRAEERIRTRREDGQLPDRTEI